MRRIFVLLLVTAVMLSCGEKMSVKDVEELESKVLAKDAKPTKDNVIQLVDAYVLFAEQNPNDVQSPDFLFKALDIAVGVNAEGPEKAVKIADVLIEKYPDFEMTPMAMFIKGFIYENMMNDNDKALDTYRHFLERYPKNPMAADVEASIKNIGIPLDELIKTFEQ